MLVLALAMPFLVASAGDCYLVTSEGIEEIPCDFSAAATDALRYAARDSPEARAKRAEQQKRDATRWRRPQGPPFVRGTARGSNTR